MRDRVVCDVGIVVGGHRHGLRRVAQFSVVKVRVVEDGVTSVLAWPATVTVTSAVGRVSRTTV